MEKLEEICLALADIKSGIESVRQIELIAHKELLTKQEAALFMGVTKSFVDKIVKQRMVTYYTDHIGANTIWISKKELVAFMMNVKSPSIPDIKSEAATEIRRRKLV